MGLLFYSVPGNDTGDRIREKIEADLPADGFEVFESIEALAEGLQKPRGNQPVAVLHASSREELIDLVALWELLQDIRIILILPDCDPWTIARGHKLRPRFIIDRQGDYSDITVILKRLLMRPQLKTG